MALSDHQQLRFGLKIAIFMPTLVGMRNLRFTTKLRLIVFGFIVLSAAGAWYSFERNIEWSARIAWGEARGEPDGGMQAVINVMVNRARDPRYPGSLAAVARQRWQFTAFNRDDPNRPKLEAVADDDPEFQRAKRLATYAELGILWDITGGATHYHSEAIKRPTYLDDAEVTATIGHHVFYRDNTE